MMIIRLPILPQVLSMYEILRRFQTILRLSPFRLEDFCAALSSEDQSNLLSEVHLSLLKTLIRQVENLEILVLLQKIEILEENIILGQKSPSQQPSVPWTRRTV